MHRAYPSVCATLSHSLKVRRLVKRRNPWIPAFLQGLRRFSCENVARFTESRRVGKNRGVFGKKRRNTLLAQIRRQTIKVRHISYQNAAQSILVSVEFFFAYTVSFTYTVVHMYVQYVSKCTYMYMYLNFCVVTGVVEGYRGG